jgi:hypothetical protein
MWGIRVIRAGVLALAVVAGAGCCETCQLRQKDDKLAPAAEEAAEPTLGAWTRNPADRGFKEQAKPLTPERVHGGIY